MEKIAFYNRKGGVGKSTTCLNVAGCLDLKNKKKVLVVDCDPQSNITTCFTINSDTEVEHTVADLFRLDDVKKENFIYPVSIPDNSGKKMIETSIKLLPGTKGLDMVTTDDMFVLKRFLDQCENDFDYCLIDCPPSLTDVTINILCAADYIMVPAEAGRDGINGYGMVVDEVNNMKENGYNANAHILGVFINNIDKRYALDRYYADLWKTDFKDNAFKSQIRCASDVRNAYEFGKPVHYYKARCNVAKDYEALTKEMMQKIKAIKKGEK